MFACGAEGDEAPNAKESNDFFTNDIEEQHPPPQSFSPLRSPLRFVRTDHHQSSFWVALVACCLSSLSMTVAQDPASSSGLLWSALVPLFFSSFYWVLIHRYGGAPPETHHNLLFHPYLLVRCAAGNRILWRGHLLASHHLILVIILSNDGSTEVLSLAIREVSSHQSTYSLSAQR